MIRKYFCLAFLIIPLASYAQVDSTDNIITFRVISKPTPYAAKIHITGNHLQLRNWAWPYIPLEERSDGVWEKTFSFATGTQLQYALILGSWECVGLDSSGNILGDSIFYAGKIYQYSPSFLEVKNDTTVTARIPRWRQGEIHLFADMESFPTDTLNTGSIWLDFLWKYHPGDNEEWANPEFDDSEWEITRTWLSPNNLPKSGWNGIGWFRLHLVVDSTLWNRPLALNVQQRGASEIYLDGRLLAQFGKVGSSKRDEEGYFTLEPDFLPPPKSIVFGKTNHVFAVRFSSFYFTENYPNRSFGLRIVLSDLNSTIVSSASQRRANTIIQMVLTIVPVVFAILHLLLFLFYQRARENLYYALFTLMLEAVFFALFQTEFSLVTDLRQALLFMKLPAIGRPFVFIAGLRFSYAVFYPRLPKQFWIFLLIGAGIGTWEWSHPLDPAPYVLGFIMISLLEMLRVAVVAIRRKKDGAWIIGTGFIFFTVAFLWGGLSFILAPLTFNFLLVLFSFGIFGLLLSMSVFLSRDFARTNKNLKTQLVQVKELSEKAIRQERERARLEAENARKSKELEEARKLQLSMLPKELPQLAHLEIGAFIPNNAFEKNNKPQSAQRT